MGSTYGCEEDDSQEVADRLDVSHDLLGDHVPLGRDQRSSQEAAKLHRDVQQLCDLRKRESASYPVLPSLILTVRQSSQIDTPQPSRSLVDSENSYHPSTTPETQVPMKPQEGP